MYRCINACVCRQGNPVFLADIWPSNAEIDEVVNRCVVASMFAEVYESITKGTDEWNALQVPEGKLYDWAVPSTYISHPPFFQSMKKEVDAVADITDAYALLNLGDSITTDHISPAGKIARNSPAAEYLRSLGRHSCVYCSVAWAC
jgi:aconitate hydratase